MSSNPAQGILTTLFNDIELALPEILTRISPRLCIPTLLTITPILLEQGHIVACAYIKALVSYYNTLERAEMINRLNDICAIIVLTMDYRRVYGENTLESYQVEVYIIDVLLEVSMKLTETELRALLARLGEWKDVCIEDEDDDNDNNDNNNTAKNTSNAVVVAVKGSNKRTLPSTDYIHSHPQAARAHNYKQYSRGVIFYHYLSALGKRLKSIFTPLIAPFWDHAAGVLSSLPGHVRDMQDLYVIQHTNSNTNTKKKSKLSNSMSMSSSTQISDHLLMVELREYTTYVVESITYACMYDEGGAFVDEVRYICLYCMLLSCSVFAYAIHVYIYNTYLYFCYTYLLSIIIYICTYLLHYYLLHALIHIHCTCAANLRGDGSTLHQPTPPS